MKKIVTVVLGLAVLIWVGSTPSLVGGQSFFSFAASSLFPNIINQEQIKVKFAEGTLKTLLIPGHNNYSPGAIYKDVKEADLTVSLSYRLADLLRDEGVYVLITRDENGEYARWFTEFMQTEKEYIENFRDESRRKFEEAKGNGVVTDFLGGVGHNYASSDASFYLYAVNAYANMNNYDIVLHPHFNNEGGRKNNKVGKYEGFAVYVPEAQLPNAQVSRTLGEEIKKELEKKFKTSSLPQENTGIVESQDLIALGSNASRSGASILVEYAYIYEAPLRSLKTREIFLDTLSRQTFNGIMNYLNADKAQTLGQ